MKKLLTVFVFANIFLAYSCSGGKNHKTNIIGKWELVSSLPNNVETSDPVTTAEIKENFTFEPIAGSKIVMEFMSGDKGFFLFKMGESTSKSDFDYTIDGDNMTINESGRTIDFNIASLKDGKMKLEGDLTEFYKKIYPDKEVEKATFVQEFKKE